MQREIWLSQQLDPQNTKYNIAEYLRISGHIDVPAFRAAVKTRLSEIEVLRTCFIKSSDTEIVQILLPYTEWQMPFFDYSFEPDADKRAAQWMAADLSRPLDLTSDALFSFVLFKTGADEFVFYQKLHHIVMDGHSASVFTQRLCELYNQILSRSFEPAAFGFLQEILDRDRKYRASEQYAADRRFWLDRLDGGAEAVSLGAGSAEPGSSFLRETHVLSAPEFNALSAVATGAGASWPQLFIAALAVYLSRATGEQRVSLGLPVLGRRGALERKIIGSISNVLPLRVHVDPKSSFVDIVKRVAAEVRSTLRHQSYRAEGLIRELRSIGSGSRLYGPTINVMQFDYNLRFGEAVAKLHNLAHGPVEDLTIALYSSPQQEGLRIDFDANPEVYGASEVAEHQRRF
ncbi:condensation domain-containing protein, partial [Mycobacterium sp. KBS0706]|uniref:condensation domain-containing protein n=1 Tax=Mycobacterium sp. KBS0706 TaxID=2578109 RepID=UPI0027D25D6A